MNRNHPFCKIKNMLKPFMAAVPFSVLFSLSANAAAESHIAINNIVSYLAPILTGCGIVLLVMAIGKFIISLTNDANESKAQSIMAMLLAVLLVTSQLWMGPTFRLFGYDDTTGNASHIFALPTPADPHQQPVHDSTEGKKDVIVGFENGLSRTAWYTSEIYNRVFSSGHYYVKTSAFDKTGSKTARYFFTFGKASDGAPAYVKISLPYDFGTIKGCSLTTADGNIIGGSWKCNISTLNNCFLTPVIGTCDKTKCAGLSGPVSVVEFTVYADDVGEAGFGDNTYVLSVTFD